MNVSQVVSELNKKYPGKAIFKNDEENTTEILCEIDPASEHPDYSNAVAVIDKSIPHIHYKTTETYKVTKGTLTLQVGKETIDLKEGESYVIKPGNPHWAEGEETWLEYYSEPGWDLEDHISANDKAKLPYRQGVYALVLNEGRDSILMVLKKNSGVWDCPGGGIDENETPEQAVKRELLEELGTDAFEVLHNSQHKYSYDWPLKEIEKNIKKSGKLMRGQEQSFIILAFTGKDDDIALQDEELEEYKWVKLNELKDYMAYPDFYEHIQKVFSEFGIEVK
ncbi:NUDIX domain-containing protein [Candidatus Nomurabacteria bacterium]|nr:NUDIX domain-containing protein [Candidatus Nomurabacteria bacterium]MCB9827053.1 NUDIX domain-containing protein [Candidatus Nomurabacteria bacterium]MCB9827905.1 NUDIX domain-containing protein [Candidatus Nomurabacteria bacterium]